ncbi:MAG: hypothetical protein IKN66_12770 [Ruminococcus sp.]|nr:hypothetical protein [Ruminococcus sp.]
MNFDQLLLSELRLAAVSFDTVPLSEEGLVRAMTVNEELIALGYTLAPGDIVTLAKSSDTEGFVQRIRDCLGEVKAKPMYPDFPSQVMAMDECVFRFHQMLHYLTTYGVEEITGIGVTRGWLPEMQDTEKTEPDTALLEAKVLALIDSKEKYSYPYAKILSKTERMTNKEQLIIAECAANLTPEELTGVSITFKQNQLAVFNTLFTSDKLSSEEKLEYLHALCQHTGDVWKCMDYALTRAKFHFRTSQKRLLVKLLESYPIADFRGNLVLSGKKAERTLLMLKYIDFNEYSRREEHKKSVADLRSGRIRSWESGAKFLVERGAPEALAVYSERPGMMLRHLTYLLRNGYKAEEIFSLLSPAAPQLKTQTLVSIVNFFSAVEEQPSDDDRRYNEAVIISRMAKHLLSRRLAANETAFRGKKVFISTPGFDLDASSVRVADKSDEGGYIRSGLAYRIPEEVKRIRFFVYWNDEKRVDIDLHSSASAPDGRRINIGWNANFKDQTMVFSGDITHSDAAEYIDIDLEKAVGEVDTVALNINLFAGYPTFGEIAECFVGVMAVDRTGTEIKLYDPKNCFFVHYLKSKCRTMNYGFIDINKRIIVFDGTSGAEYDYYSVKVRRNAFSVNNYLDILLASQGAEKAESAEAADAVIVMGKPSGEKELSLIDNNFFME